MVKLREHQVEALKNMRNGCILCGGTGSGKSITSIAYYMQACGGSLSPLKHPKIELYIITTAQKRDKAEWDEELIPFGLSRESGKVHVDSWNNLHKYIAVRSAFFIFDEQRVTGSGQWVKSFLKIAKENLWILLSATPGDKWIDYAPVFIANGFYKNLTEFRTQHVIYSRYVPHMIDKYWDTRRLERYRNAILVDMPVERVTVQHHIDIYNSFDMTMYKKLMVERFDYEKGEPFANAAALAQALRKTTCNDGKLNNFLDILKDHPSAVCFYNFDYELAAIKDALDSINYAYAEWNGHKHQDIPDGKCWVYLVNYNAGSEGWNCVKTDTMIFFSNNYSYRMMIQAAGRIDRLNTRFTDLWYYHLKTKAPIDRAIDMALSGKKKFNESRFFSQCHITF